MLAHRLAARGGRTVRELMASMDALEWARWKAFDRISPLGDERLERMIGTLTAVVLNKLRADDEDAVGWEDVTPDHGGARAEAEAEYRRSPEYRERKLAELRAGFLRR